MQQKNPRTLHDCLTIGTCDGVPVMQTMKQVRRLRFLFVFLAIILTASAAHADVIRVGQAAFGGGSTLITFEGLAQSPALEVNGLNLGGIVFSYSLGNGNLIIGGGPFLSNNVFPPNIESVGNPTGILTLQLGGFVNTFGYGYALNTLAPVANATTITLFSGATNVGSLSYNAVPDVLFSGGFAGIFSTVAFDRVELTFNSAAAPNFAVDNIRTAPVPEPATLLLLGTGLGAVVARVRKRRC